MARTHWTEADRQLIHDAIKSGKTPRQIAEEFGTTPSSINTIINRRGLKANSVMRECMTCGLGFGSEWIGNRRCSLCKLRDDNIFCN